MARLKSEEKQKKLLAAATKVFAKNGLSASTASITNEAGLAEGTLFVYFKGKDELINTLYREIKHDLACAMLSDFPRKASVRVCTQHVWNKYVEWAVKNQEQFAVLNRIKVWEGLDPKVREETTAQFCELHSLTENAVKQKIFQDIPHDFIIATLTAQAETTMLFMKKYPKKSAVYRDTGFEVFWNGISKKS